MTYDIFRADDKGRTLRVEASYGTVAEVLAYAEEKRYPLCIKVGSDFFSMDAFMEKHVGAG
jgi:hypothetical protein